MYTERDYRLSDGVSAQRFSRVIWYLYEHYINNGYKEIAISRSQIIKDVIIPMHGCSESYGEELLEEYVRASKKPCGLDFTPSFIPNGGYIMAVKLPSKGYVLTAPVGIADTYKKVKDDIHCYLFVNSSNIVSYDAKKQSDVDDLVTHMFHEIDKGLQDQFQVLRNLVKCYSYVQGSIAPSVNVAWCAYEDYLAEVREGVNYNPKRLMKLMKDRIHEKFSEKAKTKLDRNKSKAKIAIA